MTPAEVEAITQLSRALAVEAFFCGVAGAFAFSLAERGLRRLLESFEGRRYREYRRVAEAARMRG